MSKRLRIAIVVSGWFLVIEAIIAFVGYNTPSFRIGGRDEVIAGWPGALQACLLTTSLLVAAAALLGLFLASVIWLSDGDRE